VWQWPATVVHGIVDDFRRQVVQGIDVGAADYMRGAGAPVPALQHLDVLGGIGLGTRGVVEQVGLFLAMAELMTL